MTVEDTICNRDMQQTIHWIVSIEIPDRYGLIYNQMIAVLADQYHNWQIWLPMIVTGDQPQNS